MFSTKRKQNVVTIETKLEIIDQLAEGVSVSFLAVRYNIGISLLFVYPKNRLSCSGLL